jgi:hypothetical protein
LNNKKNSKNCKSNNSKRKNAAWTQLSTSARQAWAKKLERSPCVLRLNAIEWSLTSKQRHRNWTNSLKN